MGSDRRYELCLRGRRLCSIHLSIPILIFVLQRPMRFFLSWFYHILIYFVNIFKVLSTETHILSRFSIFPELRNTHFTFWNVFADGPETRSQSFPVFFRMSLYFSNVFGKCYCYTAF